MAINLRVFSILTDSFLAIDNGVDRALPERFRWAQESIWRFKAAIGQIAAKERSVLGQSFMVETYSRYANFGISIDGTFGGTRPKGYGHCASTLVGIPGVPNSAEYYTILNAETMAIADHNTVSLIAHSLAKSHDWRLTAFKALTSLTSPPTSTGIDSLHAANLMQA